MSDTPRFTDTSTATPEEKARRVLQYLADPKERRIRKSARTLGQLPMPLTN